LNVRLMTSLGFVCVPYISYVVIDVDSTHSVDGLFRRSRL